MKTNSCTQTCINFIYLHHLYVMRFCVQYYNRAKKWIEKSATSMCHIIKGSRHDGYTCYLSSHNSHNPYTLETGLQIPALLDHSMHLSSLRLHPGGNQDLEKCCLPPDCPLPCLSYHSAASKSSGINVSAASFWKWCSCTGGTEHKEHQAPPS